MKVEEISFRLSPLLLTAGATMTDKELKNAAADFAAIFYEKVLAGMLQTHGEPKGLSEDIWWDMLTREVAREISLSSPALAKQIYEKLAK